MRCNVLRILSKGSDIRVFKCHLGLIRSFLLLLQVVFLQDGCSYCATILPTIEKISLDAKFVGVYYSGFVVYDNIQIIDACYLFFTIDRFSIVCLKPKPSNHPRQ